MAAQGAPPVVTLHSADLGSPPPLRGAAFNGWTWLG
jgi:hypothetical protein